MTSDQHELFSKFLKLKPPVFKGAESEDAYDFLVDCHEFLYKMGIVERFGVEFVTYQFKGERQNVVAIVCGVSTSTVTTYDLDIIL